MTLGEKLQELRKTNALSQEKFAERMQVSRQAVSKWELDQTNPELDKLIEISNYYAVSMDYLLKEDMDEMVAVEEQHEDMIYDHLDTLDKTEDPQYLDKEKTSFDLQKMFMLTDLAIIMTALRFFVTKDFTTGFVLVGLAIVLGVGIFIGHALRTR